MTAILVLFVTALNGTAPQVLAITAPMPAAMCQSIGMPMAAAWIGEHPKLRLSRLACVDPKQIATVLGKHAA